MKKDKYIILAVFDGITKQFKFGKNEKDEAINAYRNISIRADSAKFYSIDSDDESIWYDLSEKY